MLGLFAQSPVIDNQSPFTLLLLWKDEGLACPLTIGLRRLKLQAENLPENASLRHSEKIVFTGDPENTETKNQAKINQLDHFHLFSRKPTATEKNLSP